MDPIGMCFVDPNLYHDSGNPFVFFFAFFRMKEQSQKQNMETSTHKFPALIFPVFLFLGRIFCNKDLSPQQKTEVFINT